jgi:hypothetical protein
VRCLCRCIPPRGRATSRPRSALTLLLMPNPQSEIEQRAKAILADAIAFDLAANVPDDAAEPGTQEFELPPGALELVGMRIAPHHDGGALGYAQIALAQFDTLALGLCDQLLDRPVGEPRVGRCAIAFSWTVVSTTTRSRSLLSIAPVRCATERLSCKSAAICSSPSRWRQRVSDERSNGSSCWAALPRRNTGNMGSPPTVRIAPHRRGCACA